MTHKEFNQLQKKCKRPRTAEQNEILVLTKMNWNSGHGLDEVLSVTLDFAKIL